MTKSRGARWRRLRPCWRCSWSRPECGSATACLVARICEGSGWCRTADSSAVEPGCSCVVGRCSFAGGQPVLELERPAAGSCSSAGVQLGGCSWLGLIGRLPGRMGRSISRRKLRCRIGPTCHRDRRSRVELELAGIVAGRAGEWAVVALVGQLASDLRWLGIWAIGKKLLLHELCKIVHAPIGRIANMWYREKFIGFGYMQRHCRLRCS